MKAWKKGAIVGVVWWILIMVLLYKLNFFFLYRTAPILYYVILYTLAAPFGLAANIYGIYYIEDMGIIASIISLPLSCILAFLVISLHESVRIRNIKGIAIATLLIGVIFGSFFTIPQTYAKYRDIKSGLFDIPSDAVTSFDHNVLNWKENGIYYEYRLRPSSGYESLSLIPPDETFISNSIPALLKYVENKEIRDEISKINIDKSVTLEIVEYRLKGWGNEFAIGTTIGKRREYRGNYVDESGEIHLSEGFEVLSVGYLNLTINNEINLNTTSKGKTVILRLNPEGRQQIELTATPKVS